MIPPRNQFLNFVIGISVCASLPAWGAVTTINRPASTVPVHGIDGMSGGKRNSEAKSKVIPLKRTVNLATSRANSKPGKLAKTTIGSAVPQQAQSKKSAGNSSVDPVVVQDDNAWDNAAKRYDRRSAAKTVTGGVRVEDIIEPTFDYQYSNGRRKNPFIPEVILTGKVARQRELSPNDVEIPIVSPLQSFGIRELSVIGVWETEDSVWKALVKTPATQGIEAKLGDPIGNSGGRIMAISPDAVVVREFSVRMDGTREYRDVPLHMGSDAPKSDEPSVGGRLILKPGATKPEILGPEAASRQTGESTISTSATLTTGSEPGTLKTVETVLSPVTDEPSEKKSEASESAVPTGAAGSSDATGPNYQPQLQQVNPSSGGKQ